MTAAWAGAGAACGAPAAGRSGGALTAVVAVRHARGNQVIGIVSPVEVFKPRTSISPLIFLDEGNGRDDSLWSSDAVIIGSLSPANTPHTHQNGRGDR